MVQDCISNLNEWLVRHTWICWYIRDGSGRLRPLWDSDRVGCYTTPEATERRWKGYSRNERQHRERDERAIVIRRRESPDDSEYENRDHLRDRGRDRLYYLDEREVRRRHHPEYRPSRSRERIIKEETEELLMTKAKRGRPRAPGRPHAPWEGYGRFRERHLDSPSWESENSRDNYSSSPPDDEDYEVHERYQAATNPYVSSLFSFFLAIFNTRGCYPAL